MAPKAADSQNAQAAFKLPVNVMTRADISRLLRELESLDNFLLQSKTRAPGDPVRMPRLSLLLEHLAEDNSINLLVDGERKRLEDFLSLVHKDAPVVHLSFAANPSAAFAGKLLTWFRTEAHPYCLLQIGLQPGLGAGFTLRTTNKYFNFSMANRFENQKGLLREFIAEGMTK